MSLWLFSLINLLFCFLLTVAGFWAYLKTKSISGLLIGCAYALFSLVRVFYLEKLLLEYPLFLAFLRSIAYSLELYAVILLARPKKRKK
jgi:hypothetical protein